MSHSAEDVKKTFAKSREALGPNIEIDIYYLHAPDRDTPFEETHRAIDELYRAGSFKRFGLSNYRADEVETFVKQAEEHGWVKPTAYQGPYSVVQRNNEPELLPVLKKHSIALYVFSPLGGGFLTRTSEGGKDSEVAPGSRFDSSTGQGKMYQKRYHNDANYSALSRLQAKTKELGLTTGEVALRWLQHHSQLSRENGDHIIIGASSLAHLKENLDDLEKGPLPDELVKELDNVWKDAQPGAQTYHR